MASSDWKPFGSSKYGVALFTFSANGRSEVSLEIGQKIKLEEYNGNGWLRGTPLVDGIENPSQKGIFPANFMKIGDSLNSLEMDTEVILMELQKILFESQTEMSTSINNQFMTKFTSLRKVVVDLVNLRQTLVSDSINPQEKERIKLQIRSKMDQAKKTILSTSTPTPSAQPPTSPQPTPQPIVTPNQIPTPPVTPILTPASTPPNSNLNSNNSTPVGTPIVIPASSPIPIQNSNSTLNSSPSFGNGSPRPKSVLSPSAIKQGGFQLGLRNSQSTDSEEGIISLYLRHVEQRTKQEQGTVTPTTNKRASLSPNAAPLSPKEMNEIGRAHV